MPQPVFSRQRHLGVSGKMDYTDLEEIQQEIHYARRIFQQGGFTMVEITNKSIEESSEEVISKLAHLTENNTR